MCSLQQSWEIVAQCWRHSRSLVAAGAQMLTIAVTPTIAQHQVQIPTLITLVITQTLRSRSGQKTKLSSSSLVDSPSRSSMLQASCSGLR